MTAPRNSSPTTSAARRGDHHGNLRQTLLDAVAVLIETTRDPAGIAVMGWTAPAPRVVLVYAINRCTSADSLEYVRSAS